MEFRQLKKEAISGHKRASSHPQMTPSMAAPLSPTENALRKLHKRKSQRILDSWPLKSTCGIRSYTVILILIVLLESGQGEDGEIVALSFSVPEDIERG